MKHTLNAVKTALFGAAIVIGGNAFAADPHQNDRHISGTAAAESSELGGKPNAPLTSLQRIGPRHLPYFNIYDAHADLLLDEDNDGFHQRLRVSFDVDVDHDQYEDVYAELFLSRDGGPWVRYHTTDVFSIWGDAADDDYAVSSRLIEGFPSGHYSVAIDLYALGHGFVTSIDGRELSSLYALPLEDADHDHSPAPPPPPSSEVDSTEGGGAAGLSPWLALLAGLGVWARRGASRTVNG